MNLSGLRISGEAMSQFQSLWVRIYKSEPKDWRKTLKKFLKNVKEVGTPSLIPIMIPNGQTTRYFEDHSDWLFVTSGAGQNSLPITLRGVGRTKECFSKKES